MKRLLFIYNPNAGKAQIKSRLADILDILAKANYELVVYPTQGYMDALKRVSTYTDKFDLLVCSGGDGTLDEVVTGMMHRNDRIPIGYIPAGSTNDFANSLRISKNMLEAADTAVNGVIFDCDVGAFNDDTFVYIAAFGLFTDVSYQTKQEIKNVLGHLAYVLEGMKRLYNIPSYELKVTYEDQIIEEKFIFGMVTNSRSVGGFRNIIGNHVVFDDGEFEVTLIKMPKNPLELNEIVGALLIEQIDTKHMYSFKAKKVVFDSLDEIPWTLDGEFGGEHNHVVVENRNKELQIMVHPDKKQGLMKKVDNLLEGESEI
ncbi:diacylglycerol/lipid kinase family protein [Lachnospiraceae bacterium LCP25S3_G4]